MKTVEGTEVSGKVLALLGAGESATFAARPAYATVRSGVNCSGAVLLLTSRRMLIIKDRVFGKPKADFAVDWTEVIRVEGSLWKGGGPKIQLLVFNSRTREPVELIVAPQHAAVVESAIRSGYLDTRR